MEEYDNEWLLEIMISLRMALSAIPEFQIGDEDPGEIQNLKEKLINIRSDIFDLIGDIYSIRKHNGEKNNNEDI